MGENGVSKKRTLSPQSIFDEEAVLEAFREHGIKSQHAYKVWRLLIQHGVEDLKEVPDLPKAALELLTTKFATTTSRVVKETTSSDRSTTKLLVELQDGKRVESVIMRYGDVELKSFPEEEKERLRKGEKLEFKSNKRATLCISSQVGCQMACTFCATGTMGLVGNLSSGEILEQLYHANKVEHIRNVVFMGMGEPLDNYDAVIGAVRAMTDTRRWGMATTRISISTVGVVPRIYKLMEDAPEISLALSLHAPNQDLRCRIVPSSKAWHIDRIMEAMDAYIDKQNSGKERKRHVMVEYVLIADVNDTVDVACQLGALLQGRQVLLNVIPYNPTLVEADYKAPTRESTTLFMETVRSYGVHTLIRQELGQDVSSACGQLVIDNSGCSSTKGGDKITHGDIEDLVQTSTPARSPSTKRPEKEKIERKEREGKTKAEEQKPVVEGTDWGRVLGTPNTLR